MNKILALITVGFCMTGLIAQNVLDAKDSDPDKMGWMKGFPPEKDKIISAADGSFFTFPALRYSVNHMRELNPTREVRAAKEKYFTFKTKIDDGIDSVTFIPTGETEPMTIAQSLDKNYVDGIIVVHKGKIVYEKYPAGLKQDGIHAAMSVSKSFTGTLGSILIAEGVIDENKLVSDYVPELAKSGFGDATVRQVMDMTTAIKYSEDYNDPNAEVWSFTAAGNPFRPADYQGPKDYYEYLQTVQKLPGHEHGQAFAYRTVNTDVMGWIISRVTGKSITELISELIWVPMGAKYDGYYQVDPAGIAFAGGGFNLNLRDMAVFGEMLRNNGKVGRKQVIPAAAVEDITRGGDLGVFERGDHPELKGWSYRNMWWITNNENKAYCARGVHGQVIYIDPTAEMVIVRFSSNPMAANKYNDPYSLPAYQAIADYLMAK